MRGYFWEDGLLFRHIGGIHKCVSSYLKDDSNRDIVEIPAYIDTNNFLNALMPHQCFIAICWNTLT